MDKDIVRALILAALVYYFTQDVMNAAAVGGASYALARFM